MRLPPIHEEHDRRLIGIWVDASMVDAAPEVFNRTAAAGHWQFRIRESGKGHRGVRDEAHLSDVFRNILIIVIAEDIAARIVESSHSLLENYAGIVVMSDVEVVRDEHF